MRGDSTSPGSFYEFFAGGGLARVGLGTQLGWTCVFANDFDQEKIDAYEQAFGKGDAHFGDVWDVDVKTLPRGADLAWASFPCQDLSLAGMRGGLAAPRSGAFFGFWRLMQALGDDAPPLIALENVTGLLTSHGGADFATLIDALAKAGYRVGALALDAAAFTPQSRPRIFVIAARGPVPSALVGSGPGFGHSDALVKAAAALTGKARRAWTWWRLPTPPLRNTTLADILEPDDQVTWRTQAETDALLMLMSPRQRAVVEDLRKQRSRTVGAAFRRIRVENGRKEQRVEARFDGVAGCLRTPAGGSSRQILIVVEDAQVRSRLISPRECARLMGAPDDYPLPKTTTAALHLMGDAVAAPVARWLGEHLLGPLALAARTKARAA